MLKYLVSIIKCTIFALSIRKTDCLTLIFTTMLVRVTILDAETTDFITSYTASFSKVMDNIQNLSVDDFIPLKVAGKPVGFKARVFKIDFKPRSCSPVWHHGLSYQITTPDTFFYMQSNLYTAMSHYFNLYADILDED